LFLGGPAVARGYLNRPGLTAEKFLPDPWGAEHGARLYRTGDLVRWLPDGQLDFLGRIDQQVKIRGYRIELGEIESVLARHPGIARVVVEARQDKLSRTQLVGYVVPVQQPGPAPADLRTFLKDKLPEYMIPALFVALPQLPLTATGKVDRRSLPAPDARATAQGRAHVAPSTEAEMVLAPIWAQVLHLEQVGTHDNFFELGGDSILSIQVVARANQAGLALTAKDLFLHQTLAELARAAKPGQSVKAEQGVITGSVPLTPIQHWFVEQDLPEPHHFNQARLLHPQRALDQAVLEQALQHVLTHHDALRLRLHRTEDGWRQTIASPDEPCSLTRVDLSAVPEAERSDALAARAAELHASLNLSEGPIVKAAWFDFGPGQSGRLLLIAHHLAVDVISWRIILEDLLMAYRQLKQGQPVRLPPKTTSFKEWAERLTEHARSGALDQERAYWLDPARSEGAQLPVDHPEGANTKASLDAVEVSLDEEETEALLTEVPRATRAQINDALLTALAQAFRHWTGRPTLLVDLEGHGRDGLDLQADISRTVGWFTSYYPLCLALGEATDPRDLLALVQEQIRGVPGRGLGYLILRYLSPDEDLRRQLGELPEGAVAFNYMGQQDRGKKGTGLLQPARESVGPLQSSQGTRRHLIEINGLVQQGRLRMRWTYSTNLHDRATMERLAQDFVTALQDLITRCRNLEPAALRPEDFPAANLSQADFNALLSQLSASRQEDAMNSP
jgi:non-ribosomal peptide synthase protein (TIGR01720 family)